ncbi:MAG: hypothetical protein Rubg2KO_41170 [Rubricoccaceae bacterium]
MPALTNLQRELLELYAQDVPEEDLVEIRDQIARYFAEKASRDLEVFADANELATETTDPWAFEHNRASEPQYSDRLNTGRCACTTGSASPSVWNSATASVRAPSSS